MDLELRFTDKDITARGGMSLMKRMLDHLGFGVALAKAGLPPPGSNRGYAPKGKTLSLFVDDHVIGKYKFSALVSDMDLPAEVVWRTYRGRADCENRIKELKYDVAADSFNMQDFWATERQPSTR